MILLFINDSNTPEVSRAIKEQFLSKSAVYLILVILVRKKEQNLSRGKICHLCIVLLFILSAIFLFSLVLVLKCVLVLRLLHTVNILHVKK